VSVEREIEDDLQSAERGLDGACPQYTQGPGPNVKRWGYVARK